MVWPEVNGHYIKCLHFVFGFVHAVVAGKVYSAESLYRLGFPRVTQLREDCFPDV